MNNVLEVEGIYTLLISNDVKEVGNVVTNIGLSDWLEYGLPPLMQMYIGKTTTAPNKTLTQVPEGLTDVQMGDFEVRDNDNSERFRFRYKAEFPAKDTEYEINALACVHTDTNNLFSLATIKNMDNDDISIKVGVNETVTVIYDFIVNIPSTPLMTNTVDTGYNGLVDFMSLLSKRMNPDHHENFKLADFEFVTNEEALAQEKPKVKVTDIPVEIQDIEGGKRLLLKHKLTHDFKTKELSNINRIQFHTSIITGFISVTPIINRKNKIMDIDIEIPIDIFN